MYKYPDRHDPPSCEMPSSVGAPSTSGTDKTHGKNTPRHPNTEFQPTPVKGGRAQRGEESEPNSVGKFSSLPATSHSLYEAAQIIQIWRDSRHGEEMLTASRGDEPQPRTKRTGAPSVSSGMETGLRELRHLYTSGRSLRELQSSGSSASSANFPSRPTRAYTNAGRRALDS